MAASRSLSPPLWRRLFAVGVLVLVALHLSPPHGGPDPLLLGVFPWDLTWHLLWMAAAAAAVVAMTSPSLWPDHDDAGADR